MAYKFIFRWLEEVPCGRSPDVIVVGELRDLGKSISLALRAAETGHLVSWGHFRQRVSSSSITDPYY